MEQPDVDRTWEEGEEAAAREREMKRRNGESDAEEEEEESEKINMRPTRARIPLERTDEEICRIVPADWLPDTIHVKRTLRSDMSESWPIGSGPVSSRGLLGPLTGQPRRSRSPIRDRDHVNPDGKRWKGHLRRMLLVTFPVGSSNREKKTFSRPLQDVRSFPRYFPRVSHRAAILL